MEENIETIIRICLPNLYSHRGAYRGSCRDQSQQDDIEYDLKNSIIAMIQQIKSLK